MPATTYIKIERTGTNEKYKGSTTTYKISECFSWDGKKENFKTLTITKEKAISIAKTQGNFVEEQEKAQWHETRMTSCVALENAWIVTTLDPYKD